MSDHVTLLGTEQVSRAASNMRDAAERMGHAASTISESLSRHERFLDDWLARFEDFITEHDRPAGGPA